MNSDSKMAAFVRKCNKGIQSRSGGVSFQDRGTQVESYVKSYQRSILLSNEIVTYDDLLHFGPTMPPLHGAHQ